jgi:hypothetical protein
VNREGVAIDLRSGLVPVEHQSDPARPASTEPAPEPVQATPLEWAWVIIANASESNWNRESQAWQDKAREWADAYMGEAVPDEEMPVALGRALALITRVQPDQAGEWRAAAAVWCRRHDTDLHRMHLYPFDVVPLWQDSFVSGTRRVKEKMLMPLGDAVEEVEIP